MNSWQSESEQAAISCCHVPPKAHATLEVKRKEDAWNTG